MSLIGQGTGQVHKEADVNGEVYNIRMMGMEAVRRQMYVCRLKLSSVPTAFLSPTEKSFLVIYCKAWFLPQTQISPV